MPSHEDNELVEERWIETEDSGDEEPCLDLFADPDPYDTFHFTFDAKKQASQDEGTNQINITLQGMKQENGQTIHSTGLTLWRASPILCDFLSSNHERYCKNKMVLELGAGLGLCGILSHRLGAKRVILTDGDTDSLAQMRSNVDSNLGDEKSTQNSDDDDNVPILKPSTYQLPCCQLRWGKNIEKFKQKWTIFEGIKYPGFDVILGSDIIYVEEILDPLFTTVINLLAPSPDACFLLSYARRNVNIDLVFECAKRHNLKWTEPGENEGVYIFHR